ncbi:putative C6 finger domain protein Acr-2 [Talaromyces proteolyticus]|uniref:C6 finger domain protein Acr-2 n=1 Tax=Talaromyces proteolyticus TaxID=1131652 RepID=A0AAD4KRQ0_9EURO|nr:putative C6 finger domain protein Acr-2 [Talaromyces proteolyticus]KAH8695511.1 putative C6 finger domain protein Acr-2 [Talaromyces proteolyticus]
MPKGCYTCRRRRIICDNRRPTCRKCHDAGKQCLGYTKPLVWVKGGVASRGKMMGLSFDDVNGQECHERSSSHSRLERNTEQQAALDQSHQGSNDETLVHMRELSAESPSFSLVDPLFRDVAALSRFYISHFNLHCVRTLALYDSVRNPYRELIPYINESPVLTDSLAAIGAIHHAYMSTCDYQFPLLPVSDEIAETSALSLSRPAQSLVPFSAQPVNCKAFEHFLSLKQRALHQLSKDVAQPATRNDDRTIAAIFVLILLDAVESGNGAWKYHLEGAKSILRNRLLTANEYSMMTEGISTFVIDACLITEIMGSTLARPGALSEPFYSQSMGATVLKRLEKTAWVGCPAYLLDIIFFIHAQRYSNLNQTPQNYSLSFLSSSGEATQAESPLAILRHIDAFDPYAWAEEMQSYLLLSDSSQKVRVALACAYKAAVYLYARRVVSKMSSFLSDCEAAGNQAPRDREIVESELVQNLSLISPDDEHFKCTIWPTFIAGAESMYPTQRIFTLQHLNLLWNDYCSVNLHNAACVLKIMWQKQDERGRLNERRRTELSAFALQEDEVDWIQELDQSRSDWLFI